MHIEIKKDLIPYRFEMEFSNGIFEFELNYNSVYDFFTIDLYKEGKIIRYAEKILYGKELFENITYNDLDNAPNAILIPLNPTGYPEERITWESFGTSIQLLVGSEIQ